MWYNSNSNRIRIAYNTVNNYYFLHFCIQKPVPKATERQFCLYRRRKTGYSNGCVLIHVFALGLGILHTVKSLFFPVSFLFFIFTFLSPEIICTVHIFL